MEFISKIITDYFVKNEIISEEHRETNIYGLEVLLSKILNYLTLILLAIWNQNFIPTIFFMLIFFNLRGRTGGFHASRRINCYIGTIIMFFGVKNIFYSVIQVKLIGMIVLILSDIIIATLAPINHPNLALSDEEMKNCKRITKWLIILFTSMIIMLYKMRIMSECVSYMIMGIGMDAVLIILAKLKNRRSDMNVVKRRILIIVSRIAEREVKGGIGKIVSPCLGYFYQPKRPKKDYKI